MINYTSTTWVRWPSGEGDKFNVESNGNVSATVTIFSYKPLKHTTKLTLFAVNDRIEIENYLLQNVDAKPVTYAFSLNLDKPEVWHEEAGAILHAKSISKGGHYADTACRFDWLALNHFADVSDEAGGMILSNRDAYFMKTGHSTNKILDDTTAQIKVLATGQIDPALGIVNQDGDSYFENFFALKPHTGRIDAAAAVRFSLEHQTPFIAQKISGGFGYNDKQFSLLSLSDSSTVAWAVKPAEEGITNGIIARVWNLSNADNACTFSFASPIGKAAAVTHIETDDKPLPVSVGKLQTTIGHNRLQTFRIFLSPSKK